MLVNPPDVYANLKTNQAYIKSTGALVSTTSLVTVSRASAATQVNSGGVWAQYPSNTSAWTDLGASIWEARTNSIRNNTMAGAVVGTPGTLPTNWAIQSTAGGLTTSVVGTGTESGVSYVDLQVSGTSGGTQWQVRFEGPGVIAAAQGQTWTNSLFAEIVGGSLTNVTQAKIQTFVYNSTPGFVNAYATNITIPVQTGLLGGSRFSGSTTLPDATTASVVPILELDVNNASAINLTIRIGWPQLENNAFINSTVSSAAIAAGGASGVAGSAVYQVGGGTGTAATLNVTVSSGAITAINSVANAGSYTVFPTSPAALTYVSGTGSGVTGATVNLTPTSNASLAAASNPILTSGVAGTRTVEADTLVLTGLPAFGSAYTVWGRATPQTPNPGWQNQSIVGASDGTNNNRFAVRRNTAGFPTILDVSGGSALINTAMGGAAAWLQGVSGKIAMAGQASDQRAVFNGTLDSNSYAVAMPVSATTINLGDNAGSDFQLNGNLEEIAVWFTQRVPNATLQAMTT
jgi:hypothetical protein